MRLDSLLIPRQTAPCIVCPAVAPPCNCAQGQTCFNIGQSCSACASFRCVDSNSLGSSSSHHTNTGAIIGAVVGVVVLVAVTVLAFFWWRRRKQALSAPTQSAFKDIPAPADTVLNRPDPSEKVNAPPPPQPPPEPALRVYDNTQSVIDLDPDSQRNSPSSRQSLQSDPFRDARSILTTSTGSQATNVIPIAFVPPPVGTTGSLGSHSASSSPLHHSPNGELNMDHVNFSSDTVPGEDAVHTGISTEFNRQSYGSNASFASDILTEAPTIVTRQVASVAKAAVVRSASLRSNNSVPATPDTKLSRPSIRSPLAASSFGPHDIVREDVESLPVPNINPFGDDRSPGFRSSIATQGTAASNVSSVGSLPQHPWVSGSNEDRPASTYTQAASVIGADIMDATRVQLSYMQPASASLVPVTPMSSSEADPRSMYRMTQMTANTPETAGQSGALERQLERAIAEVQSNKSPEPAIPHRASLSTMASGVSARADSILESFTFVPPSPISNRPIRTPPRSPLAQDPPKRPSPPPERLTSDLEPPDRRTLGMSTGSQLSAMSTGLGSFPFQIDNGNGVPVEPPLPKKRPQRPPPPSMGAEGSTGKQRASLDTLALTSDLSSYPLGFDRQPKDSFATFMANKQ